MRPRETRINTAATKKETKNEIVKLVIAFNALKYVQLGSPARLAHLEIRVADPLEHGLP